MKKITLIALLFLTACATPPRPVNDPSVRDDGEIYIRLNNNSPSIYFYQYDYICDPMSGFYNPTECWRLRYDSRWRYGQEPQIEFRLKNP